MTSIRTFLARHSHFLRDALTVEFHPFISNTSTDFSVEKDCDHSNGMRDCTNFKRILSPNRPVSTRNHYYNTENGSVGTSTSVNTDISCSEVDNYPTSFSNVACDKSFAIPPTRKTKKNL